MNKQNDAPAPTFIETARRAQIVQCAIETIAERGYARASLAQIGQRCGISTGVITYHFASKDDLMEQVVETIYRAGAEYMIPRIAAHATPRAQLRAYIQSNVEFIGQNRRAVLALVEIMHHLRKPDGAARFDLAAEEPQLAALDGLLRLGQQAGELGPFDVRVMTLAIRRAIDALPPLLAAKPDLDVDHYARELAGLFDRAAGAPATRARAARPA